MISEPRFVEIVRVSTKAQAARDTPEDQRAALDRLRRTRPGTFVTRIDEAVSGAKNTASRSDMAQLFELAAARAFDEIRVRHIDRLTRHDDPRERFAIYGAIRDAGAVIVEASGRVIDPADEMGELDLTLQGWFAARERKRILERTIAAKKRKARDGRLPQGQPPFGRTFDKTTGVWGINEDRAKAYRRMFDLCLSGRSLGQIAATLNADGVPTTRGREWTDANVARLLRDPAAVGRYTAQEHTFTIPRVVDEETFRAVDQRLRSNNCLSGPKPTIFALLRKLATCGACGSPMYLQLGGGTPSRIRYYYCSSHDRTCRVYHRVEEVDARVIEALRKWLDTPETLADTAALNAPEDVRKSAERDIREAEAKLRDLRRQVTFLLRKGRRHRGFEAEFEKELAQVHAERANVEAALATAQAQLDAAERHADVAANLSAAMANLRKGLADATPQKWRELCEIVFPRRGVRLHPNGKIELSGRVSVQEPLVHRSCASGTT
jgi:DNA invertase Pin-like site-specific DNA recombinase/ribosome-associated translation inhibitor RaiA